MTNAEEWAAAKERMQKCSRCDGTGHADISVEHVFFPGFDGKSDVCIGWEDEPSCGGLPCPACDGGWPRGEGS